jgi:DNA gyrase subunit A
MVVAGADTDTEDLTVLTVCERGYGKRTVAGDYRLTKRGGKGVMNIRMSDRNGAVVSVRAVQNEDELMIISQNGILIRLPIRDIRVMGRATQGVRLINLEEGDNVIDVACVVPSDDEAADAEGDGADAGDDGPTEEIGRNGT